MSIEILVATSKKIPFRMPDFYKPVQINSENSSELIPEYYHDNTGDNISIKNPNYCELTALYWGWKNSSADIIGLCHYRRFFSKYDQPSYRSFRRTTDKHLIDDSISREQIEKYLNNADIIVGMPHLPYPLDAYEDLKKSCYERDIRAMIDVVNNNYKGYYQTLESVLHQKNLVYFNMMICKKELMNDYCSWLFSILGETEERCDLSNYSQQRKRLYGYLAEVLLNVYILKHSLKAKNVELLLLNSQLERKKCKSIFSDMKINFERSLINSSLGQIADSYYKVFKPQIYESYLQCLEVLKKNNVMRTY